MELAAVAVVAVVGVVVTKALVGVSVAAAAGVPSKEAIDKHPMRTRPGVRQKDQVVLQCVPTPVTTQPSVGGDRRQRIQRWTRLPCWNDSLPTAGSVSVASQ